MRNGTTHRHRTKTETGFTLLELLVVVAIIAIMAAVALPNIGQYIRNYKIRGATQQLANEIQAARTKAIMTNTNTGVSFVVVDADSYRFVLEDNVGLAEQLGPLRHLPYGVQFQPGTGGGCVAPGDCVTFRYNRLGGWCKAGTNPCGLIPFAGPFCITATEGSKCTNSPAPGTVYMQDNAVANGGGTLITLREAATGITRQVRVVPGGRVMTQQ